MFVDNRYKGREFLKLLILVTLQKAQILVSIKSTISSQVSLLTSQRQRVQLTVFLLGFHSKVTNSPIPHLLTQAIVGLDLVVVTYLAVQNLCPNVRVMC